MKRKRAGDQAAGPLKRLAVDPEPEDDHDADAASTTSWSAEHSDYDSGVDSDDNSTPPTTIATVTRPDGTDRTAPPSTSTTRSRKIFPSMLKTIQCTFPGCSKTFNRPARLTAHLRTHTGDRALKCPHDGCDKAYFNEKHLQQHIKGSHSADRQYACPEPGCGKTFLTGTRLRRHAAVHSGEGRFRCTGFDGCDKVFRKHQTLQRHVRADHLGERAFPCTHEGCTSEGFDSASALRKHVQREHGEPRFWCDECGGSGGMRTGFTTMGLLNVHMRSCHVDCIFCEVKCGSKWELERHVEMHHSGATAADRKVVACTWPGCDKTFTRNANLNVHVKMVHEGYRFVCGELDLEDVAELPGWDRTNGCGAGFHAKKRLEDHIRVAHLGMEKPARKVREDVGIEAPRVAGLFSLFSSTPAGDWGDMAPEVDVGAAPETGPFLCHMPGCMEMFSAVEQRDAHAISAHLRGAEQLQQPPLAQMPDFWDPLAGQGMRDDQLLMSADGLCSFGDLVDPSLFA